MAMWMSQCARQLQGHVNKNMSCARCKEVAQSLKSGAVHAHLSPKAQIQDPLALNLPLRLNLNHTAVLIGCHDSYAHSKSVCHSLESHMVPPCAKLLHTLTVIPIIFRNVLPI